MIDEYTIDKQKAPDSLQDLVRKVICGSSAGPDDKFRSDLENNYGRDARWWSSGTPGLYDVRSGPTRRHGWNKLCRLVNLPKLLAKLEKVRIPSSLIPDRLMVGQRPLEP